MPFYEFRALIQVASFRWDWSATVEEVIDSLHALVQAGKVLYLGISNTPAWIVSAANTYARDHGKTPFTVYQGQWNVIGTFSDVQASPCLLTCLLAQQVLTNYSSRYGTRHSANVPLVWYGSYSVRCDRWW
jgi:aryl-alcohol dehydrogenase-like predicted oxidoreductase